MREQHLLGVVVGVDEGLQWWMELIPMMR